MIWMIIGIILIITVSIITAIISINIASNIRSQKKSKKNPHQVMDSSPYRKSQLISKPHIDFLFYHKEREKEEQNKSRVEKYDPNNLIIENNKQETKIVGIAKPKGFWSKFIMSQKLGYIIARMTAQDSSKGGFWVNLIKAQSVYQGKDQSRGR